LEIEKYFFYSPYDSPSIHFAITDISLGYHLVNFKFPSSHSNAVLLSLCPFVQVCGIRSFTSMLISQILHLT